MTIASEVAKIEAAAVKDLKTFVGWAVKEEKKITGEMPAVISIADKTLSWARLVLPSVLVAAGDAPAAAVASEGITVAQNVVDEASKDLTAIQGAIYDAGTSPTITSAIQSVQSNLGGLLTAGHVTSTKSVGLVTKVVSALGELVSLFTPTPSQATA